MQKERFKNQMDKTKRNISFFGLWRREQKWIREKRREGEEEEEEEEEKRRRKKEGEKKIKGMKV